MASVIQFTLLLIVLVYGSHVLAADEVRAGEILNLMDVTRRALDDVNRDLINSKIKSLRTVDIFGRWIPPRKSLSNRGAPLDTYQKAMKEIVNGALEAMSSTAHIKKPANRTLPVNLNDVDKLCYNGDFTFARRIVGQYIFKIAKSVKVPSYFSKPFKIFQAAKNAMDKIRRRLPSRMYGKLIAINGDVSIGLVVGTTGEALPGIQKLATELVRSQTDYSIDYILSYIDQKDWNIGDISVTHIKSDKKEELVSTISKILSGYRLPCNNLRLESILKVFSMPIDKGSPIFVFANGAPDKMYGEVLQQLLASAQYYQTPLNFLLYPTVCLSENAIKFYQSIAKHTGGEVLIYNKAEMFPPLATYIKLRSIYGSALPIELQDETSYTDIRADVKIYQLTIDDEIDVLKVLLTCTSHRPTVELTGPYGFSKRLEAEQESALFVVYSPTPGIWKLKSSQDDCAVSVHGYSSKNINFDYNFALAMNREHMFRSIRSREPVKGQETIAVLTVTNPDVIDTTTLKVSLVKNDGTTIAQHRVQTFNKASGLFHVTYRCPSSAFFMILEGKISSGRMFKRLSSSVINPTTVVSWVLAVQKGVIVTPDVTPSPSLLVAVYNYGMTDKFNVKLLDNGSVTPDLIAKELYIKRNKLVLMPVTYSALSLMHSKIRHNSVLKFQGKTTKAESTLMISFKMV